MPVNDGQIVGIGEILWDLLPAGKELGGAPANFAYHSRILGMDAAVVSSIGYDPLGEATITRLQHAKIGRRYISRNPCYPTGTVSVTLNNIGVPTYFIHENVAWDHIPWSEALEQLASSAMAVGFGTLSQRAEESRQTIRHFLQAMPAASLKVCDINLRQSFYNQEIVTESLRLANVLKLNDEELTIICAMLGIHGSTDSCMQALLETYELKLLALTRGSHGSLMLTATESSEHEGYPAIVVDTVGAGDAFAAAMVVGFLRERALAEINDFANRIGAYVCARLGAMPDMAPFLRANDGEI